MPSKQPLDEVAPQAAETPAPLRSDRFHFGARDLATLLPSALLLASLLHVATSWGAGHQELLAASAVVVVTQVLPGIVIWRWLRPRAGWWVEDVALGLPIGAAMAVPSQIVAVWVNLAWAAAVVPLAVAAGVLAVPTSRARVLSAQSSMLPWLWGVAVVASCALPAVNAVKAFREPVRWTGWATHYVDIPYHLALSGELAHRFPPHYPQVGGEPLYYHWFAHAWVAQVSNLSGAPLDVILLRFMPVLLAVAIPLATAAVAMRIAGLVWAGPLAAVSAFAIVQFDVWGFGRLSVPMAAPNSPTQGFGLLVLLPTLALISMRWRGEGIRGSYAVLLPLLMISGGSKGSVLAVVVAGALLGSVAGAVRRWPQLRLILVDTVTATAVLIVLTTVLFGGGVGGTRLALFEPLVKARGASFMGAEANISGLMLVSLLVLAMLPIFVGAAGSLWVLFGRQTHHDPVGWMLAGGALAGAGAIVVLDHPSLAQYYFLYTGEALLSILAGWGIAVALAKLRHPGAGVVLGAVTGLLGVVITRTALPAVAESATPHLTAWAAVVVFACAAGLLAVAATPLVSGRSALQSWRTTLAVFAVALSFAGAVPMVEGVAGPFPSAQAGVKKEPGAIHRTEARAARWIRDMSKPDDIVMTNRHCRTGRGENCDHRQFYVAAYSERRVLVEGWAYTKQANAIGRRSGISGSNVAFWDPRLLALNDEFFVQPSSSSAKRLYDLGVRWIYMHMDAPHADAMEPAAVERFRTRSVRVYELLRPASSNDRRQ